MKKYNTRGERQKKAEEADRQTEGGHMAHEDLTAAWAWVHNSKY